MRSDRGDDARGGYIPPTDLTLRLQPRTRAMGCVTAIVGGLLAVSGLALLLLLLASSWGRGFGTLGSLLLLIGGLGLGSAGAVWIAIGAGAALSRPRTAAPPPPEDSG